VEHTQPIRAAGAVVWRNGGTEPEVVLIHRPRWVDWSFPKGKVDPGELTPVTAVREVAEETGLTIRLGPALPDQQYDVGDGAPHLKHVSYWTARARGEADLTRFEANSEVDEACWLPLSEARQRLSYPHDAALLETFAQTSYASSPLLVVRHAQARSRKAWKGDDSERTLHGTGGRQAVALSPLLAAYGVRRVVSSDAVRCVDTVLPYVNAESAKLRLDATLSEEASDAGRIRARMQRALGSRGRVAFCSHRKVIPDLFAALGLEPIEMAPADAVVLHRAAGSIVAVEHHRAP
jgi:8-oxo-dGTP diphosphatase